MSWKRKMCRSALHSMYLCHVYKLWYEGNLQYLHKQIYLDVSGHPWPFKDRSKSIFPLDSLAKDAISRVSTKIVAGDF